MIFFFGRVDFLVSVAGACVGGGVVAAVVTFVGASVGARAVTSSSSLLSELLADWVPSSLLILFWTEAPSEFEAPSKAPSKTEAPSKSKILSLDSGRGLPVVRKSYI